MTPSAQVYHAVCAHCLEKYVLTDLNKSASCGSCEQSSTLINMWAKPRGKAMQFPECVRSNKDAGYEFVSRMWRRFKRCPKMLLPNADFSGSMYEGYMGSLMASLFLQKESVLELFENFDEHFVSSENINYEHAFSLKYWESILEGGDLRTVFGMLKGGLKGGLEDFSGGALPASRRVYVGTLWSTVFLSKKFDRYDETLGVFLRLLNVIVDAPEVASGLQSVEFKTPKPAPAKAPRLPLVSWQVDGSSVQVVPFAPATASQAVSEGGGGSELLSNECVDAPDTDTLMREMGSMFDELTEDDKHVTVKRLKFDHDTYMFNDLVELLISKRTHVFKKESNQNFLCFCMDSGMLSDTVMNYGLFTKFILMAVPEDIKDLSAACDHIGKEMIRLLRE